MKHDQQPNSSDLKKSHPSESAWWASKLMVFWITPLIQLASIRPLVEADIWDCPQRDSVDFNSSIVSSSWNHEKKISKCTLFLYFSTLFKTNANVRLL